MLQQSIFFFTGEMAALLSVCISEPANLTQTACRALNGSPSPHHTEPALLADKRGQEANWAGSVNTDNTKNYRLTQ